MNQNHPNGSDPVYHEPPGDDVPRPHLFELRFREGEHAGWPCAWGMDLPDGSTLVYCVGGGTIIRGDCPERTARRLRAEVVWL